MTPSRFNQFIEAEVQAYRNILVGTDAKSIAAYQKLIKYWAVCLGFCNKSEVDEWFTTAFLPLYWSTVDGADNA